MYYDVVSQNQVMSFICHSDLVFEISLEPKPDFFLKQETSEYHNKKRI